MTVQTGIATINFGDTDRGFSPRGVNQLENVLGYLFCS
jgi:hypothetical protein